MTLRETWTIPFIVATLVALVATPLLRRLAHLTSFVDHPNARKSHNKSVAYLGGVAIVFGTAVGSLAGPVAGQRTFLLLGGGTLLAIVGLVDDRRHLGAGVRLIAQLAMATAAYAAGIRAVATGVPVLDLLITVLWIAGMSNSLNLFDNMDGLATSTAIVAGISLFFLAALGGQYRIASISIALAGACLGFLAFNFRPATIYMGDAGSLFLGFLLSTLTLQVAPDLGPPGSFVVPLLLLAVPLVDTVTVVIGRLRHGRSPLQGGKDHLSHRLVVRGFTREGAVAFLVAAQAVFALLGVLVGRNVVPLLPGLGAAALMLVALVAIAARGRMYSDRRRPLPRRLQVGALFIGFLVVASALPAVLALISARGPVAVGASTAQAAIAAARLGDTEQASELFAQAEGHFDQAGADLGGPLRSMGLIIPGLSSNLRAARVLVSTGKALSRAGVEIAATSDPSELAVSGGQVDLAALADLTPKLLRAEAVLRKSQADVRGVDYSYLVPTAQDAVRRLDNDLTAALGDAERAATVGRVLPAILGGPAPRRYFLAVQNNAEARATGGFIGNFGELATENGRIRLARFGRIGELNSRPGEDRELVAPADFVDRYGRFDVADTWQNVNLSPDLPTVTRVIADLYPRSGGQPVDGVVTVDPAGLAGLLRLTGPITVPGFDGPITSDNVVQVTLEDAYVRFPDQERRVAFLGDVARTVFEKATTGDLGSPRAIIEALAEPVRGGHLQVALLDGKEDQAMRKVKLNGGVPQAASDSLLLTTQNAAGNKIDTFLRRRLTYDLEVSPAADGQAEVQGTVRIELENQAPATGLPPAIIGPYDDRFEAGENRTFLSLYTPLQLAGVTVDGVATGLESGKEFGRQVYSTFISMDAKSTEELTLQVQGKVPLTADGSYRLDLLQQPVLTADHVEVRVRAGEGYRLVDLVGLERTSRTEAKVSLDTQEPQRLSLRLASATKRSLVDRLLGPPADAELLEARSPSAR